MSLLIKKEISQRKNFKANRVRRHQRFNLSSSLLVAEFQNPDSMLMDKIINNIKQEMKGKNEKKTNGGPNS
jgi:hypothetical protein